MQKWIGYRGVFFTFISPVRVAAQDLHCFYAALTGLIFVDIIKKIGLTPYPILCRPFRAIFIFPIYICQLTTSVVKCGGLSLDKP